MGAQKFGGTEVEGKTLGVLGFGRIGQLVAIRARAFGMHVLAYDPFVARERFREIGVEQAESPDDVLAAGDFITLHLPKTPETQGFINADTLAQCKDGVRIINVARGPLVVDEDLKAAIDCGKVAGAALDVFAQEPITDHPLFGYPNVVVTPHLGASTAEAQDRAGVQTAEQVVAALTGGVVSTAVNIPAVQRRGHGGARPVHPARAAARPDRRRAARAASSASRSSTWAGSPSATRACSRSPSSTACSPAAPRRTSTWSTRPTLAEERGISVSERRETDRARLRRPDPRDA